MDSKAISLVFTSALIHATWNVVSRSLKGNTAILVVAHFIGALLNLLLAYLLENDFYKIYQQSDIYYLLIPSIIAHALYVLLLAAAYVYGDVGLVYPIARGFAILLATTIGQFLQIDKPLHTFQILGICVVLLGIILLCLDAQINNNNNSNNNNHNTNAYHKLDNSENGTETKNILYNIDYNKEIEFNGISVTVENDTDSNNPNNNDINYRIDDVHRLNDFKHNVVELSESSDLPLLVKPQMRVLTSIALALLVGTCTATYSLVDSQGVLEISALSYSGWMNFYSSVMLVPYIFTYHRKDTMEIYSKNLKYLIIMAPSTCGAYLIILFVFEIPNVDVALVVTFREFSVIIGALLGIFLIRQF